MKFTNDTLNMFGEEEPRRARGSKRKSATTPPTAPQAAGTQTIPLIDLDQIDESPYGLRRIYDEERLEQLADSIRERGLIAPIIVRRLAGSARYQIIKGERRRRACLALGHTQIAAVVVGPISDEEAEQLTISSYEDLDDLTQYERSLATAAYLARCEERGGDTRYEAIGKVFRCDRSLISKRISIARAFGEDVLEAAGLPVAEVATLTLDALYHITLIDSPRKRLQSLRQAIQQRIQPACVTPRKRRTVRHREKTNSYEWREYEGGAWMLRADPDQLTAAERATLRVRIEALLQQLGTAETRKRAA